ncbi:uncharacterized protein LOC130676305 [Microplitis mediator]|uniref:uncharacterized protein LOC130676305 n=1 Tax=Microplitis mediator TaxID=375433 RepID=UPI0025544CD9|nr:uncharacterized protein LOC130676305 [Microplitis mediator]
MVYTSADFTEMIILYGECNRNASAAARVYRERFLNRDSYPDKNVILRALHRSRESGNLMPNNVELVGRPREVRNVRNEERVLAAIRADSSTSTRRVERQIHISRSTVNRITRTEKIHPYHRRKVQKLEDGDYRLRMDFCQFILDSNDADPNFLRGILWTDESLFTREGCFNQHNSHWYEDENPHMTVNRNFQNKWKINVWGRIIGDHVILYELPETMDSIQYLTFLRDELPQLLGEVNEQPMWFQHDGAPSHYAGTVRDFLNGVYPQCWLGRNGPRRWPPRSPDLTPLDFFLWGHCKEMVYFDEPQDQMETVARINAAQTTVTAETLEAVRKNLLKRCRLCLQVNGRHFEHLLD